MRPNRDSYTASARRQRWALVAILAMAAAAAPAQSGGAFRITSATVDGGGGVVSGGAFRATTTIAQADAHAGSSAGGFVVRGGFWPTPANDRLFVNGFEL